MNKLATVIMTAFLSTTPLVHAKPFPVYFADVISENGQTTVRFDWRPDYKSYEKAVITDAAGNVVNEVAYWYTDRDGDTKMVNHPIIRN